MSEPIVPRHLTGTPQQDGDVRRRPPAVVSSAPAVTGAPPPVRAGVRRAARSKSWMLDQLPVAMLDADFFVRFVSIFQELGSGLLEHADNIEHLADAAVAPDAMVRWLATWIGQNDLDPSLPEELQRRVVAGAAETLAWRGTVAGLRRFLALTTDGPAEVVEGGGVWRDGDAPDDTAWVRMSVQSTGWLPEEDFVELVRDEIPAHVRAELWVEDRRVWSSDGSPDPLPGDPLGSVPIRIDRPLPRIGSESARSKESL